MKIEQLELQPKLEKLSLRKELKRKRQGELTGAVDDYSPALPGSVGMLPSHLSWISLQQFLL